MRLKIFSKFSDRTDESLCVCVSVCCECKVNYFKQNPTNKREIKINVHPVDKYDKTGQLSIRTFLLINFTNEWHGSGMKWRKTQKPTNHTNKKLLFTTTNTQHKCGLCIKHVNRQPSYKRRCNCDLVFKQSIERNNGDRQKSLPFPLPIARNDEKRTNVLMPLQLDGKKSNYQREGFVNNIPVNGFAMYWWMQFSMYRKCQSQADYRLYRMTSMEKNWEMQWHKECLTNKTLTNWEKNAPEQWAPLFFSAIVCVCCCLFEN